VALATSLLACSGGSALADPFCNGGGRLSLVRRHVARVVDGEAATTALHRLSNSRTSCTTCHVGPGPQGDLRARPGQRWPLNAYGHALTVLRPELLGYGDAEDAETAAAFARIDRLPANPSDPAGLTFGERIRQGLPPSPLFPPQAYEADAGPPGGGREPQPLGLKDALGLVLAEDGPILQVGEVAAIDAGATAALARFAGDVLMIGLRSLPADVAARLATSAAETVWLPALATVEAEAAAALAGLRGDLVMTGLERLESAELAAKLAGRPGRLVLPCLRFITPEAATALVARTDGICLAALAEVAAESQAALAAATCPLDLPALRRIESQALARRLAAAPIVRLGGLESLPVEIARVLVEPQADREGVELRLDAITDEVLAVIREGGRAFGTLTVLGDSPTAERLRTIVGSGLTCSFPTVTAAADDLAAAAAACDVPFPGLRRLDSATLAAALVRSKGDGPRCMETVTTISPAAAAEIAKLQPNEPIRLSSLATLPIEVARPLLATARASVLLPCLDEISTESLALLLERTRGGGPVNKIATVILGVPRLPKGPFAPPARKDTPRLSLMLPTLASLSAEDVRNLLACLRPESDVLSITVPELSPEAAAALAEWGGVLQIGGLRSLPPAVAAALARCTAKFNLLLEGLTALDAESAGFLAGTQARFSLAGLESLTPAVAAALVRTRQPLRLPAVRTLSLDAAAALVDNPQASLIGLPGLTTLEPEVAKRLASCPKWEPRLPNLIALAPETAAALTAYQGPFAMLLPALRTLDAETARALVRCPQWRPHLPHVRTLEAEAAAALAEWRGRGRISLDRLETLTPAAAAALAACPQWDGQLRAITALDTPDAVAVASALATKAGPLALPRLQRISPKTLAALIAKHDVQIPRIETLTLIAEPDGSPTEDVAIPREFLDRQALPPPPPLRERD
jgi:hypothetical protein